MASYASVKAAYSDLPAFKPLVPVESLGSIALISLVLSFVLVFYMTTLSSKKFNASEVPLALLAAGLAGAGTVALSCAVGVNV